MLKEIKSALDSLNLEEKIVIFESKIPKIFSSGHDLKEIKENFDFKESNISDTISLCSNLMKEMQTSNKLFIAYVDGLATAAGLQLVASCDYVIATEFSKFAIPGSSIGLYAATPAIPLLNILPPKIVFDILIAGKTFSALEMYKFGLVNKISKKEDKLNDLLNICQNTLNSDFNF